MRRENFKQRKKKARETDRDLNVIPENVEKNIASQVGATEQSFTFPNES